MKILLINNESREASLMARVLQRMGHDTTIAMHPNDVLTLIRGDIDAVIASVDMPGMTGVMLAEHIQLRVPEMPVAFIGDDTVKTSVLVAAAQLGPVLPALWTITDLKQLVGALHRERRLFGGKEIEGEPVSGCAELGAGVPELIDPAIGSEPVVTHVTRRVRLAFSRWSQVEALCDRWSDGPVVMSMRLTGVAAQQRLSVALALPDGTTMMVDGEVAQVRDHHTRHARVVVRLTGLTPERIACLHTMCHQLASAATPEPAPLSWERRMTADCQQLKVSDIIIGNIELRSQIDQLARKLGPK